MLPGDLVFVPGQGLSAWVIRKFTHGPYSHVAICVAIDTIVEAVPPRVRQVSNTYLNAKVVRPRYGSYEEKDRAISRATEEIGKKYSMVSLFSDLLNYLGCPLTLDMTNEYNCAELVSFCLGLDMRNASPNSLFRSLM